MNAHAAAAPIADPFEARRAGRDALSLALMDARNRTLRLLAAFEAPAGSAAGLAALRIAAGGQAEPSFEATRTRLLERLEAVLDALSGAPDSDEHLNAFRAVLFEEDSRAEQLAVLAQSLQVPLALELPAPGAPREPLRVPAASWRLGTPAGGFVPEHERIDCTVAVPEFEIDAQPVSWGQYAEFVLDGGYDQPALWRPEGWEWLQGAGRTDGDAVRRAPRHVAQIGAGAVLLDLFGRPRRMGAHQAAMHLAWWEADAWARWAGRRIATEAEWELAAHQAARRGFRFGEVMEWTAGGVLRGASFAMHPRLRHPKARRPAQPGEDQAFTGFRTCAL